MYENVTGDTTLVVEYTGKEISSIHPDKYLPIGEYNSISRIVSSMSDNPRVRLVEFISEDDSFSLLYTTDKYINYGGIVFRIYRGYTSVWVRRYLNIDGQILYLPSKFYNRTSGRYDRYTEDYSLSIDTLVQRVLSEIETPEFMSDLISQHDSINLEDRLSLEEISEIVSASNELSVVESLIKDYSSDSSFESKYDDYLWRCTNIKDTSIGRVLSTLSDLKNKDVLYRSSLREKCGEIFSGIKIADRLYK